MDESATATVLIPTATLAPLCYFIMKDPVVNICHLEHISVIIMTFYMNAEFQLVGSYITVYVL
jgi:hypothetical protein